MFIILDTSILVQDFHLSGAKAKTFIDGLRHIPNAGIGLPAVVVEETVNKFAEAAHDRLSKATTAVARLEDLILRHSGMSLSDVDVDAAVSAYRHNLLLAFSAGGTPTEVLPYPNVLHADIVRRAIAKAKPFASNGSGYRDCLIWETVLASLRDLDGPVAFITANTNDFGQGGQLHPELQADIVRNGVPPDRLEYYNELQHFNERHIVPRLTELKDVARRLSDGSFDGIDLYDWALHELPPHISVERIRAALSLPRGVGEVNPGTPQSVRDVTIYEVYSLSSDAFLIHARAVIDMEMTFVCDYDDTLRSKRVGELIGLVLEPGQVAHREIRMGFAFEFEAILDVESRLIGDPYVHTARHDATL